MEEISYETYTKNEMLEIIKKGFVFVETSLDDDYIISIKDIPDFIMLESERTEHIADMEMYFPGVDEPILTTMGCYLDKIQKKLRNKIIKRLVKLQTTNTKPKNVKVFDNYMFNSMSLKDKGIENREVKDFDKLYKKYMD